LLFKYQTRRGPGSWGEVHGVRRLGCQIGLGEPVGDLNKTIFNKPCTSRLPTLSGLFMTKHHVDWTWCGLSLLGTRNASTAQRPTRHDARDGILGVEIKSGETDRWTGAWSRGFIRGGQPAHGGNVCLYVHIYLGTLGSSKMVW
jgi:hypothetical protein